MPLGETKTEETEEYILRRQSSYSPFGKLRLTESDLIFSTHASERTLDNCVLGVELDKIIGCLAYLQQ